MKILLNNNDIIYFYKDISFKKYYKILLKYEKKFQNKAAKTNFVGKETECKSNVNDMLHILNNNNVFISKLTWINDT